MRPGSLHFIEEGFCDLMENLAKNIAETLQIPETQVVDELAYSQIPQWDSFNHVNLMLMLEATYGIAVDEDIMVELTSVRAIREHLQKV